MAFFTAVVVTVWAAKGVALRDPLKPHAPAEDQEITLPRISVIETSV
jgi:hypothetical protein